MSVEVIERNWRGARGQVDRPRFYGSFDSNRWDASLPASVSANPSRGAVVSATAADQIIDVVYGGDTVTGLIAARKIATTAWFLAIIFGFGEDSSFATTDVQCDGVDVGDITWITHDDVFVGSGSESTGSFTGNWWRTGWGSDWTTSGDPDDETEAKKYVIYFCRIDADNANFPGTMPRFTATLGGHKFADWNASTAAHTSSAKISYDLLTDTTFGLGLSSSRIDTTTTFSNVHAHSADTMADSTDRYSYQGQIQHRDVDAALAEVLGHCLAAPYVGEDGVLRLWAEMPPATITGTWSCSGTTWTEDGTSGAATTELAVGQRFWDTDNNKWITVESITDDDTFESEESQTTTSIEIRPTTDVWVRPYNWLRMPTRSNPNKLSTPRYMRVLYNDKSSGGQLHVDSDYGSGEERRTEVQLKGCPTSSMASRWGATRLDVMHNQSTVWRGVADGIVADLEPGDVFFLDDGYVVQKPVRLLAKREDVERQGHFQIEARLYSPGSYSTATESAISIPIGAVWDQSAPDNVTNVTQVFGRSGDWDYHNLIPDPDDLSGWTQNNCTASYGSGYTSVTYGGSGLQHLKRALDITDSGNWSNNVFMMFVTKGSFTDKKLVVTAADTVHDTEPLPTTPWAQYYLWDISTWETNLTNFASVTGADFDVKDVYIVKNDFSPGITAYLRYEWTPPSDLSKIKGYQLIRHYRFYDVTLGYQTEEEVVAFAPVGEESLSYTTFSPSAFPNINDGVYHKTVWYSMRVLSKNGTTTDFPDPTTQTFEETPTTSSGIGPHEYGVTKSHKANGHRDLTESTATTFATLDVADGEATGGMIQYVVRASDGTDEQVTAGQLTFAAAAKSGTITTSINPSPSWCTASSSGTLSATFTAVDGGSNELQIKCNAVSSLTQTTLEIWWWGVGDANHEYAEVTA